MMPVKPSRSAKKKHPTQTRADRKILDDLECATTGGLFGPVLDVVYFLRENHRQIDGGLLEGDVYRTGITSPYPGPLGEKKAHLERVGERLAVLKNSAKKDLKPQKRKEFLVLLKRAIERIVQELHAIPSQVTKDWLAVRETGKKVPAVDEAIKKLESESAAPQTPNLEIITGGFVYRSVRNDLSGNDLLVLSAFVNAPHLTCTIDELHKKVWLPQVVSDENVKTHVQHVRAALIEAKTKAGIEDTSDPLRVVDRGRRGQHKRTAWRLEMP